MYTIYKSPISSAYWIYKRVRNCFSYQQNHVISGDSGSSDVLRELLFLGRYGHLFRCNLLFGKQISGGRAIRDRWRWPCDTMNRERHLKISYDRRTRLGLFSIGLTNFFLEIFSPFLHWLDGWEYVTLTAVLSESKHKASNACDA